MTEGKIDCVVHGQQKPVRVSIDGGDTRTKCEKCVQNLELLGYRVTLIGGLNLPVPREHEGRYVYGQD